MDERGSNTRSNILAMPRTHLKDTSPFQAPLSVRDTSDFRALVRPVSDSKEPVCTIVILLRIVAAKPFYPRPLNLVRR